MKELSTLIKLSALLVIGGGTVGAAVGITEAQSAHENIVENNEMVHAVDEIPNLGRHTRIYIQVPNEYLNDNATLKFKFCVKDIWNFEEIPFTKDSKINNLYYYDTNGNLNYNVFKLERYSSNGNDYWNGSQHEIKDINCNYFEYSNNFNDWNNISVNEKYFVMEKDLADSVDITKENKDDYHHVFLDRNMFWNEDGDIEYLHLKNKNGVEKIFAPLGSYPTIRYIDNPDEKTNKRWLANYSVPTQDLLGNAVNIIAWNSKSVPKVYAGETLIFPQGRTNFINVSNENVNNLFNSAYNSDKFELTTRSLAQYEKVEPSLASKIFIGLNSCSDSNVNGKQALKKIVNIWRLDSSLDILKDAKMNDYQKIEENSDGTKSPTGNVEWSCLYKYEEMLGIPHTVTNTLNTGDLVSDSTIAVCSVTTLGTAAILGFVFLNKKKRPLIK